MQSKLTRGLTILIGTAAAATTLSIASPAFASSATSSVASTAASKHLLYAIYPTSGECRAAGDALIYAKYARDYQCLWDSPGFALWVDTVK
jgi:exo-beta-1,3-glucanase (GH17 family)